MWTSPSAGALEASKPGPPLLSRIAPGAESAQVLVHVQYPPPGAAPRPPRGGSVLESRGGSARCRYRQRVHQGRRATCLQGTSTVRREDPGPENLLLPKVKPWGTSQEVSPSTFLETDFYAPSTRLEDPPIGHDSHASVLGQIILLSLVLSDLVIVKLGIHPSHRVTARDGL